MLVGLLALLLCTLCCSNAQDSAKNRMTIQIFLEVLNVVRVNEDTQLTDFDCALTLHWNPWVVSNESTDAISNLNQMWEPDIMSWNSEIAVFHHSNKNFDSRLEVTWTRKLRVRVPCEIQLPSHDAYCQISFTSKSHDLDTLLLEPSDNFIRLPDDATSLAKSGYRLRSAGVITSYRRDPCCDRSIVVTKFPINLSY